MKAAVVVQQADLQAAVKACYRLVPKRAETILSHILVQREGEELVFVGDNRDMRLSYHIPCEGDTFPPLLVPGRLFADYIHHLPPGDVHLTVEESSEEAGEGPFPYVVRVVTGSNESRILCGDGQDFPEWELGEQKEVTKVTADALQEGLRYVVFTAARQHYQAWLESVAFTMGNVFQLGAADGFRAAMHEVDVHLGPSTSFLVPAQAARELIALMAREDDAVRISCSDRTAVFSTERWTLSTRLVEGEYPDLRQFVPASGIPITVARKDLLGAAQALFPLAKEGHGGVTLSLSQGTLVASVPGSEYGDGRVELEAEADGQEVTVVCDVKYLTEPLQVMSEERMRLVLPTEERKPVIIRPASGDYYTYLLMPMVIPETRSEYP